MREALLNQLVHPDTQAPLDLNIASRHDDDVVEGTLTADPSAAFPIHLGIPTFVPYEVESTQTVKSFDQKWDRHRYYREHTGRFYMDWFLKRYGFESADGLRDFLADKRTILDAGTGSGRDAVMFADHSTANVFGVDTSEAALSGAREQVTHPRVSFIRADLNRMPFPDEYFDLISCDQVIHHTPQPRETFERLRAKLRTGGQICCYVYRRKAVVREFTDDYVRDRIRDLPIDEALKVCEGITHLGRQLAELNVTLDVEHDIPVLGIPKGKIDLQRFFHWHLFKCFWNNEFDFFTNNIVNFDWYHPEHCHRFEPHEFRAWFDTGWEIIAWDEQEAGMSCRARKV